MPVPPHPAHASSLNVDAAIIGGGIAGSALAITLRRLGMEVALFEREPSFRDRIRGEAIHPWGVREVAALGLRPLLDEAGAVELPYWTTYRDRVPGDPYAWTEDVPDSPGELSVGHPRLQDVLIRAAGAEGAHVFRPARATPARTGDGWTITVESGGDTTEVRAKLLVGADGRTSVTRKLIGANAPRDPIHHQFGGILVRGIDLAPDSAHQGYYEGGFTMVFPQKDDLARVYYVGPNALQRELLGPGGIREFLRRVAGCFPEGALDRVQPAGPLGFFPNADVPVDRIAGEGIVMIGDAAGANDPTQGHGLSLVFRDVRVLRDLLAADVLTAHDAFEQRRMAYYHVLRTYAAWVSPLLTDTGEVADALREQVRRAREADPSAEGYANLLANGPDGLSTDAGTRGRFYGEHLPGATVRAAPTGATRRGPALPPPA